MAAQGTSQTLIARRYARAFFDLAQEQKKLDEIAGDLEVLAQALEQSAPLRRALSNPLLPRAVHRAVMKALCEKAGLSQLTQNFVGVLAENRRLSILADIIAAVQGQISEHRGEIVAEVVSAAPLSAKQEQELTEKLKKALGSQITLKTKIDKTIIGGLMVRMGSRLIDDSVSTKLARLHRALRGNTVTEGSNQTKIKEVA